MKICRSYRYSRAHAVPSVDSQQDFCLILSNISGNNFYVAFERFLTTGDANDISFISNLYLMFSMGSYTSTNNSNTNSTSSTFNPQHHVFRIATQTTFNLLNCVSSKLKFDYVGNLFIK